MDEARPVFEGLIRNGRTSLEAVGSTSGMDFFAKFGDPPSEDVRRAAAHYLIGLGMLGLDKTDEARAEFEAAASLDINHLWSRAKLAEMD